MNLNYIDQLTKFHRQQGHSLAKFPSVDKKPLDLYKLKKAVEQRGGFAQVCTGKRWAEIGRDLGYSGKIMSSLSTSLKNSYQKWLYPYEEYLKFAKPGVQQKLELENGTPSTPSPRSSPTKQQPDTNHARHNHQLPHNKHLAYRPSGLITQATLDLHAQTQASDSTEPRRSSPVSQSTQQPTAHTAGFTPINVKPATNGLTHIGPLNDRRSVSSQNDVHVLSTSSTSQSPVPDLHSSKRRFSGEGVTSLSPHFDGSGRKFKRAKTGKYTFAQFFSCLHVNYI